MDSHNGIHIFEDVTCFTKESVKDAGLVSVLRVNDCCRLPGTEGEGEGQGGCLLLGLQVSVCAAHHQHQQEKTRLAGGHRGVVQQQRHGKVSLAKAVVRVCPASLKELHPHLVIDSVQGNHIGQVVLGDVDGTAADIPAAQTVVYTIP